MSDNYYCKICCKQYSNKQNFFTHLKSEKHLLEFLRFNNNNDEIDLLSNSNALNRKFDEDTYKKLLDEKDKRIDEKDKRIIDLKCQIDDYKKEKEELKLFIKNNINKLTKSIQAITYANLFYKNAPEFKKFNFELDENKINDLLISFENNKLEIFIGNILIKNLKKEKSEDQSIWLVDSSRLKFIYKDEFEWKKDNNSFIKNKIIDISNNEINRVLQKYMNKINEKIYKDDNSNKFLKDINIVYKINELILTSQYANYLLKIISPTFFLELI
jgi:hypothetical protein